MALALGNTRLNVKKTGVSVTIPNNSKARLMYYLDCICNALELDTSDSQQIRKLRDYKNYWALSDDEVTQLLLLCVAISPDKLINKVLFQDDDMCGDSSNEFYEITAVQSRMVVASSIVIGGQTKRVNKIMTFKMVWLRRYYLEPMQELAGELERRQEAARRRRRRDDGCVVM
ncbi:hypothetical protein FSP39_020507 [Pinctada imbricata]|uniref:Uncharacterized protein n=1 Tax=Pinctada imbricata TaxID=66713 RepID=A0AA88XVL3_PINIB|nr:hypothetical protein FSP39_020507 [Pinctada imbricata]